MTAQALLFLLINKYKLDSSSATATCFASKIITSY